MARINPLTRKETRVVNELWKLRDLDRKSRRDSRKHIKRRRELVEWIKDDCLTIQRRARARKGGWQRLRRGERYQVLARAAHAAKGGRVPKKKTDAGAAALRAAKQHVGRSESGYNDAWWLRQIENQLPHDRLDWMIPSNPYCGLGVIWSWWRGVKLLLPDGFVSTPNICPSAGKRFTAKSRRKFKLVRCSPSQARPGAILVFNFGSGGAKHTGLARGPARNGQIATREFNTSSSNAGSQSNGGGCYDRWRSTGLLLCCLNVVEI